MENNTNITVLDADEFKDAAYEAGTPIVDEEKEEDNSTLTDEQINQIEKEANKVVEESDDLQQIANMPSNNGKVERSREEANQDKGEYKMTNVLVDPNTGENKIFDTQDPDSIDNESFEDFCKRIEDEDFSENTEKPITQEELTNYINNDAKKNASDETAELVNNLNLSESDIKQILEVTNKKMNKEEVNCYKELPDSVKDIINKYMRKGGIPEGTNGSRAFRNSLANALIEEFILNITSNRIQSDFAKEIEDAYNTAASDISDAVVGYTQEKNKEFRDAVEKIEDPEKKKKLEKLIDRIDEAYNLNELAEFAKTCKIKRFEIEKPARCFDRFINKYKNTKYNIYDINMCIPILARNINIDDSTRYNIDDVVAFLDVFCKQTLNMFPSNAEEMVYMYFFIHNIVIIDINKKSKNNMNASDGFIKNVQKVIDNIRVRNSNILKGTPDDVKSI